MNILIIKSHPRASGFAHQITETYKQKQELAGNTVEILDLMASENQQSYAEFCDETHIMEDDSTKRMQEKITWADELVFVFPVWWMDCPAIMKNWIDRNFTSGFAFKYTSNGVKKLLIGKTAKVFATSGGPGWFTGFFMSLIWKIGRLGFVGLKSTQFHIFGSFPKRTQEERQNFLKNL